VCVYAAFFNGLIGDCLREGGSTLAAGQLIFLGTGTSHGVPMIGCHCPVCRSTDPRNKRCRCSVLLKTPTANLLVDTPPELRLQLVRADITTVAAVLFTHTHADHLFGLDDLRRFNSLQGAPVPIYGSADCLDDIRRAFAYVFDDEARRIPSGGIPRLALHPIDGPFDAGGVRIVPVPLGHGRFDVFGFRIGDMAYCTDCDEVPRPSWPLLEGLDVLVIDALRHRPHPTHFHLEESLAVIERLKPKRAYLTHLTHDMDHQVTQDLLADGIHVAYDGLVVDL